MASRGTTVRKEASLRRKYALRKVPYNIGELGLLSKTDFPSKTLTLSVNHRLMVAKVPEVYVNVAGYVVKEDLSPDNYKVEEGNGLTVYVRKAFADVTSYVKPEQGFAYVRPESPRRVLSFPYNVALYVRFTGTSGYLTAKTTIRGQRAVLKYQYVRPISSQAPALMYVVNLANALNQAGLPWTAVMVAYVNNRPRVLYVRSIYAYYQRYHSKAGVKAIPEIRFIFTKHLIGGLKKRTPYYFDLIVLYGTQVPKPRATATATVRRESATVAPQEAPKPTTYVKEAVNKYVVPVEGEHIAEGTADLKAKERELLASALDESLSGDLSSALDKLEKARKLREALRHVKT